MAKLLNLLLLQVYSSATESAAVIQLSIIRCKPERVHVGSANLAHAVITQVINMNKQLHTPGHRFVDVITVLVYVQFCFYRSVIIVLTVSND